MKFDNRSDAYEHYQREIRLAEQNVRLHKIAISTAIESISLLKNEIKSLRKLQTIAVNDTPIV